MIVAVVVVALVVVPLLIWRARRRAKYAGLVATKPTFSVEPPARRHHNRRSELL